MSVLEAFSPGSIEDALELLARYGSQSIRILAGGTDLMVFLKEKKLAPRYLLNICTVKSLAGVREEGERLVIGPLLTHGEAHSHPLLLKHAPLLADCSSRVGSPQIRHKATLGGNVCTGSPAGDSLPALAVLGARFTLSRKGGTRVVDFKEFFTGPQRTVCAPDELLTEISIEKMPEGQPWTFHRLGMRKALSVTKVSLAARAALKEGFLEDVRIALGSVAPTVVRASGAEQYLSGKAPSLQVREEAGRLIRKDCRPIDDVRSSGVYRNHVVGILLMRFLEAMDSGR
ncbi:MAG: xanthine dehydrogenase family protein subunit M [Candidatus Eremiobacteraeota bacterium]|nr:xanthine dehydrogenase family protein subunit M [Candidatus Eremiobacteraeota bacterium]